MVARASLHMWEEPCLSGEKGAGTVFFSGCSLKCVFCQNKDISTGRKNDNKNIIPGKEISIERLTDIFFMLKEQGAENIDLVTPSHFMPSIKKAIIKAKDENINIPFVYNSGGYDTVEAIKELEGVIDVYLPDFKYYDDRLAIMYSNSPDYFHYASESLREMVNQIKCAEFDHRGIMKKGVIVRHMIIPSHTEDSKKIIKYLYNEYGDKIYISIMNQYTPVDVYEKNPELNRKLTKREYNKVIDFAVETGITNGFIQEGKTASESFIPQFFPYNV